MAKKAKGKKGKAGGDGPPGDWPLGKDKVKAAEHSRNQARARNVALKAELVQRNDEASRATAELRIAARRRDEARAQASGLGGDIVSVQRDFARLFKARQQTLIDQISGLENAASDLRFHIEETELRTMDMVKSKNFVIGHKEAEIDEIKHQMRKQVQEFDDMMSSILEKLSKEVLVSTAPKALLNAGVPIVDTLEGVNRDIQERALA